MGMGKAATADRLRSVPLFAGLSDKDLRRLAGSLNERTFDAGHEVMVEGRDGVGFFIIEDGEARVTQGGRELCRLGPGDHFGELALIDGGARTATVTALSELRCRAMTAWSFRPFVEQHADVAWSLLKTLVARQRDSVSTR